MCDASNNSHSNAPVYGFLCEQTNVFYAFETQEEYQEFLTWLQESSEERAAPIPDEMISEEELRYNFDRATENIMKVFEDPVFQTECPEMDLEEVDFWRDEEPDPYDHYTLLF